MDQAGLEPEPVEVKGKNLYSNLTPQELGTATKPSLSGNTTTGDLETLGGSKQSSRCYF